MASDSCRMEAKGTDFFDSQFGNYAGLPFWRKREAGRLTDPLFDLRLRLNGSYRKLLRELADDPVLRVLVVGVEVPARARDLRRVMREMAQSRHEVSCQVAQLQDGQGKFQNINRALGGIDLQAFDWLIITDDDVALPPQFLDSFLGLSERAGLHMAMPAHRNHSYLMYRLTQRHWNSLVRRTHFVECGPVTAFRREVFDLCMPFPELRWAWGTDVVWSEKAWEAGHGIGVVDACALEHLRPVAGSYNGKAAREEADAYLQSSGVFRKRAELLQNVEVKTSLG